MAGLLSFARRQLSLRCAFEVVNVRKFGYWANLLRHTAFSVGSNSQRTPSYASGWHASLGPRLLRNCPFKHLAGGAIDEGEAELGGALTQAANDALAVLGIIRSGPGVPVRPRLRAERRKIPAARLAEGGVLALRSRPPEILLWGARVSQDVKCFSVGQRAISVPISASRRSAL